MKISDKSTSSISQMYTRRMEGADKGQSETISAGARQSDQIELSSEALALEKATNAAVVSDDVRWDKVNQLRQSLAQGTYQVSVDDLAGRLIADA